MAVELLLGDATATYATADQCGAGREESYSFVAKSTGVVQELALRTNGVANTGMTSLVLGIMADSSGKPGAVLGQGTAVGTPAINSWITVTGLSIPVTTGVTYWLTLLPIGGIVHFNVSNTGGGNQQSKENGLVEIKAESEWNTFNEGPIGFRAEGPVGVPLGLAAASSSSSSALTVAAARVAIEQRGVAVETKKANATNLTPVYPEGVTQNDLIVMLITLVSETARTLTYEGATVATVGKGEVTNSGEKRTCYVAYGLASTFAVLGLGGPKASGECTIDCTVLAFRKGTFNASEPINVQSASWTTAAVGVTAPTIPSLTTSVANCLALACFSGATGAPSTWGSAGWAELQMAANGTIASKAISTASAIGTVTYKKTGAKELVGMLLVINPLGEGASLALSAATSTSAASSAITTATRVPITSAAGGSVATAAYSAKSIVALVAALSASEASAQPTAATSVGLAGGAALSGAVAALRAATALALAAGASASEATGQPSATGSAHVALVAATSSSMGSASLAARTLAALASAASESGAVMGATAKPTLPMASATSTSTAALVLTAKTLLVLSTTSSVSSAVGTITVSANPTPIPLASAASLTAASAAATAPTSIMLATGSSTSASRLTVQTWAPLLLASAGATSAASLAVHTPLPPPYEPSSATPLAGHIAVGQAGRLSRDTGRIVVTEAGRTHR